MPVFRFSFKLVCNYDEAQDITQETFIRAWTHISDYTPKCRFSTWLYKITANLCYDLLRMRKREITCRQTGDIMSKPPDVLSEENPENTVINQELIHIIGLLTEELTPKQRLVFTLRELEGLENDEITIITGLDAAKIKSNLYLARKYIQERMKKING